MAFKQDRDIIRIAQVDLSTKDGTVVGQIP